MATLSSLVITAAQQYGQKCALKECICCSHGEEACKAQAGITYDQLLSSVTEGRTLLQRHGVQNGTGVGIFGQSIPSVMALTISIMESGGAVAPITEASISGWGKYMLEAAKVNLLLWPIDKQLDSFTGHRKLEDFVVFGDRFSLWQLNIISERYKDWDLAYILSTSGSTGSPKIVKISHACLLPNVHDLRKEMCIGAGDRILQICPLTFDASIIDVFLSLGSGACLLLIDPSLCRQPSSLKIIIESHSVTFMEITPALLLGLLQSGVFNEDCPLKAVINAGEKSLTPNQVAKYRKPGNATKVYNCYGQTEMSCYATISLLPENGDEATLGRPLSNTSLKVVDEEGSEIQEGLGELIVCTATRFCYINDQKPCGETPVQYRSGDYVEIRNGEIYFKGRNDQLIKRSNHRMNLDGLSAMAMQNEAVKVAASVCLDDEHVGLFVVPKCHSIDSDSLHEFLKKRLLPHWLPSVIIPKTELPWTSHGKINTKALEAEFEEMMRKEV